MTAELSLPPLLAGSVGRTESGRRWLAGLPELLAEVGERWSLRLGQPFHGGTCAWVAPVALPDGDSAVLKVSWPHREMTGEAEALRLWDGLGAVRLLRCDSTRHALLLERCRPGGTLHDAAQLDASKGLRLGAEVLAGLWQAPVGRPTGLERLADVTADWAGLVEQRMREWRPDFDPGLVAHGARLLRELPRTATREVVLHGDFNPGNLLAARREPWLAIDPKPMIGDPGYDPWPLLAQVDDPFRHPYRTLVDRTTLLAEALGEEPHRIAAWAVARQVETALWAVAHRDIAGGRRAIREVPALARLAGL